MYLGFSSVWKDKTIKLMSMTSATNTGLIAQHRWSKSCSPWYSWSVSSCSARIWELKSKSQFHVRVRLLLLIFGFWLVNLKTWVRSWFIHGSFLPQQTPFQSYSWQVKWSPEISQLISPRHDNIRWYPTNRCNPLHSSNHPSVGWRKATLVSHADMRHESAFERFASDVLFLMLQFQKLHVLSFFLWCVHF